MSQQYKWEEKFKTHEEAEKYFAMLKLEYQISRDYRNPNYEIAMHGVKRRLKLGQEIRDIEKNLYGIDDPKWTFIGGWD